MKLQSSYFAKENVVESILVEARGIEEEAGRHRAGSKIRQRLLDRYTELEQALYKIGKEELLQDLKR